MTATPPTQPEACRFTLDGSDELERHLARLCEQVRQAVLQVVAPKKLEALVLGGGYGRGQGGVQKTETGDAPYNDLEFYVFIRGNHLINELRYRDRLLKLGDFLSPQARLHVEFKVDSLGKLRRSPVSIFSYDLVCGHRIIWGSRTPFHGCERHSDSNSIPQSEATRLLLNRCSGLLLAQELLLKSSLTVEESDFVGRNLAKAKLALGDALLTAHGKYHWDCLERSRRLRQFNGPEVPTFIQQVIALHAAGVRFKLRPNRAAKPIEEFRAVHCEITQLALQEWLWIENHRLKTNFSTLREYSFSALHKCGESAWRNLLLNLRTFGTGATLDIYGSRYPRERLFNTLPLLLAKGESATEPATRRQLQSQLHTRAHDWSGLVAAYKQVWNRYG